MFNKQLIVLGHRWYAGAQNKVTGKGGFDENFRRLKSQISDHDDVGSYRRKERKELAG
jgi:hypothetical protein